MELREFTPAALAGFIGSEEYEKMPVVPISRHRALSHFHNPRVAENDVILVMAYADNKMAGYLGVLADYIYLNGKQEKAGWLSCMWVDPEVRGQGIAKQLLNRVLERWDNRILVTEFTPAAKGLYDRSNQFQDLKISEGLRCFLRFNLDELLPKKYPFFQKIKPLLKLKNFALNLPNELRLQLWQNNNSIAGIKVEPVADINGALAEFIEARQQFQLEKRTAKDLNWLLKNPWLLPLEKEDGTAARYHFSAFTPAFEFLPLQVFGNEQKLIGFMILGVRGNDLKVPYCYADPGNTGILVQVILQEMLKRKLRTFTVFQPSVVAFLKQHSQPFIYLHPLKRHYIISKKFAGDLAAQPMVEIQDGDADCAFT